MSYNSPVNLPESPIYKKALDIFKLSQNISIYLNNDLCELKPDGTENCMIYFSGDIVQQSISLVPQIVNAALEPYPEQRHKHIISLKRLIHKIYKNSYRLEATHSNGKDFLPLLRSELNKFKKLQKTWLMSL